MSPSRTALLSILLLLGVSDAFKLSDTENAVLQDSCGREMKVSHYSRKVLNGTAANSGEAPWVVPVYLSTTDKQTKTIYTTGTLISDHHLLTYDSLFLANTTDGIKFRHNLGPLGDLNCKGHDLILPYHLVKRVSVFMDILKATEIKGSKQLQVRSVTVLDGCKQPFKLNRVALVELTKPIVREQKGRPICTPCLNSNHPQHYGFYGFGDNRGDVIDATLRHTQLTITPCNPVDETFETFCAKSQQPLCNGDFGGAAVRKIGNHVKAFGIYVGGPYECSKANKDTIFTFANLTTITGKVCDWTGICEVAPRTSKPSETSTTLDPSSDATQDNNGTTETGMTASPEGSVNGNTNGNRTCVRYSDEDDDVHITIKLGEFKRTGDKKNIVQEIRGPISHIEL